MIVDQNPTSPLLYVAPSFFPPVPTLVGAVSPASYLICSLLSFNQAYIFGGELNTTSPAFLLVPGIAGSVCLYTGWIHSAYLLICRVRPGSVISRGFNPV